MKKSFRPTGPAPLATRAGGAIRPCRKGVTASRSYAWRKGFRPLAPPPAWQSSGGAPRPPSRRFGCSLSVACCFRRPPPPPPRRPRRSASAPAPRFSLRSAASGPRLRVGAAAVLTQVRERAGRRARPARSRPLALSCALKVAPFASVVFPWLLGTIAINRAQRKRASYEWCCEIALGSLPAPSASRPDSRPS